MVVVVRWWVVDGGGGSMVVGGGRWQCPTYSTSHRFLRFPEPATAMAFDSRCVGESYTTIRLPIVNLMSGLYDVCRVV